MTMTVIECCDGQVSQSGGQHVIATGLLFRHDAHSGSVSVPFRQCRSRHIAYLHLRRKRLTIVCYPPHTQPCPNFFLQRQASAFQSILFHTYRSSLSQGWGAKEGIGKRKKIIFMQVGKDWGHVYTCAFMPSGMGGVFMDLLVHSIVRLSIQ